jgi:hypothetical protein
MYSKKRIVGLKMKVKISKIKIKKIKKENQESKFKPNYYRR